MNCTCYFQSPIGLIKITGTELGISEIIFVEEKIGTSSSFILKVVEDGIHQLEKYFQGKLKIFTLKLDQKGTEFQQSVWNELSNISFGKTISYQALAIQLGDKKSTRAVASANAKNKLAIVIPCHRVINSNNELTGYAWNLERKKCLLEFEKYTQQINLF